jgi:hypothetical protein
VAAIVRLIRPAWTRFVRLFGASGYQLVPVIGRGYRPTHGC